MTIEILTALVAFAFVTSITPGPNNMMLLASGANFGFVRTIPHMLGIGIGFTIMVMLVGAGLMQLFDAWPPSYLILKVLSAAYMLWLAWKIAHSASPEGMSAGAKPMTFTQAALFQWVNPKAWTMALSAITLYAPGRELLSVLLVAIVFGGINLPTVSTWTILGQKLRVILSNPRRLTVFNWTMAALLVISLIPSLTA
ncbi:LysE family translocator [Cognatishimia activa]|uniref:Cysteine/O-acetylserine efflux protein n=1 Tax=Cognatishimia activa TaxID=1715691 RepID=A0A0P1IR30_9RHOB|nr:LysE family translocator [Cognatishimia activa]CUJ07445.1 Cysteine/O-acetylserine efflux protein [Cognatishimia activa]CUK25975.1 Cysteine/O-acetylserine efflux protein [Cognatishimia activa]